LSGVYRAGGVSGHDTLCKLKLASSDDQLVKLERERALLQLIIRLDVHLERQKHLVNWLHPSDLLTHDSIHFLDETGEYFLPTFFNSCSLGVVRGLVLESGGLNLKEFLKNQNHLSVPMSQRTHILEQIVEAVRFLHKLGIVHFDLKPENIVSFTNESTSKTVWKLIDFDSSHNERPSNGTPINGSISDLNIWVTEAYAAPEVVTLVDLSTINWRMDIWSLGLVAFFLFTNQTFWSQYSSSVVNLAMVSALTQQDVQLVLSKCTSTRLGTKDKSFIESCLQIDPSARHTATQLLQKSLFRTSDSTVQATTLKTSEDVNTKFNELLILWTEYQQRAQNLASEELTLQLGELHSCLSEQMERIRNLSLEEIENLLRSSSK
jgi:serine/threonine protein kinase